MPRSFDPALVNDAMLAEFDTRCRALSTFPAIYVEYTRTFGTSARPILHASILSAATKHHNTVRRHLTALTQRTKHNKWHAEFDELLLLALFGRRAITESYKFLLALREFAALEEAPESVQDAYNILRQCRSERMAGGGVGGDDWKGVTKDLDWAPHDVKMAIRKCKTGHIPDAGARKRRDSQQEEDEAAMALVNRVEAADEDEAEEDNETRDG